MSDISFNGNKLLKTISKEFTSNFPYLYLRFYDENGKAQPHDIKHSEVRVKKAAKDLSVNGNTHVGNFERNYESAYGTKVEVMYVKNDRRYRSLDEDDELSLSKYNQLVKGKGADNLNK